VVAACDLWLGCAELFSWLCALAARLVRCAAVLLSSGHTYTIHPRYGTSGRRSLSATGESRYAGHTTPVGCIAGRNTRGR
jgi:hypothetical protein